MTDLADHSQHVKCVAVAAAVGLGLYVAYKLGSKSQGCGCCPGAQQPKKTRFNTMIRVDDPKCSDFMTIEEVGERKSFCRCWKSKTWPLCDDAHKELNRETGDNLGPLKIGDWTRRGPRPPKKD